MKLSNVEFLLGSTRSKSTALKPEASLTPESHFQALLTLLQQKPQGLVQEQDTENPKEGLLEEVTSPNKPVPEKPPVFAESKWRPESLVDLPTVPRMTGLEEPLELSKQLFDVMRPFMTVEKEIPRQPDTYSSSASIIKSLVDLPKPIAPVISPNGLDKSFTENNVPLLPVQLSESTEVKVDEPVEYKAKVEGEQPLVNTKITPSLGEEPAKIPLPLPEVPARLSQESSILLEQVGPTKPLSSPEMAPLRTELSKFVAAPLQQMATSGGGILRIQIFPENLGHIDLLVSIEEGTVHAQLTTSTSSAKEALEHQLPQLRQALLDQGVSLETLVIEWQEERDKPEKESGRQQPSPEHRQSGTTKEERETEPESQTEQLSAIDYSV